MNRLLHRTAVVVTLFTMLLLCIPAAPAQVSIGANFQATGSNESGFVPPDTTGSVGPNHWMQYDNGAISFFRKNGTEIGSTMNPSTFWLNAGLSSSIANSEAGDPRLQYDPLSGRWFAIAFTGESTNNRILIGRSNTSDPTGGWKATYYTTTNNRFADYPTLGFDRNGVYIGTNNFGGSFNVSLFAIPKSVLLQDSLPIISSSNSSIFESQSASTRGFTLQGVTNFNLGQSTTAPTVGQMVAVDYDVFSVLNLTTITGTSTPGAALSTANINVQSTSFPPDGRQPNSTNSAESLSRLDAIDDRIGSRVYRVGDRTFLVHGVGVSSGARAGLRVTILNSLTNAVVAETTISDSTHHYYMGAIAVNRRTDASSTIGDVVIGYTRSGFVASGDPNNRWPSSYATIGTFDFATGVLSFGTPVELRTGVKYGSEPTSATVRRWGDYSATNVDPTDPGIIWTVQEFGRVAGVESWGTQATELIPAVSGEVRWLNPVNGNFATAANWFLGVGATSTDHVIFSRNGDGSTQYTVMMPGTTTDTNRLSIRQGNVAFTLSSGAIWNVTNTGTGTSNADGLITSAASFAVADFQGTASVLLSGGGTLNTVTTTIGAGLNGEGSGNQSIGSLTISGTGTTWNNSGSAWVGGNATREGGRGSLSVLTGATASVSGTLNLYNRAAGLTPNTVSVGAVGSAATLSVGGLSNPGTGTVFPTVSLPGTASQLVINGGSGTTFAGIISGAGSVTKNSAGAFTLTGANSHAGATTVNGGTLALVGSGSIANSTQVNVNAGGTLDVAGVTGGANFDSGSFALASGQSLRGAGAVTGAVRVRDGSSVSPGTGSSSAGDLTINGNVTFLSSAATFEANLNGTTAGANYDRLTVNGIVTLSNATLSAMVSGFTPAGGERLFIIVNDGTDSVSGTFNGLPEGAAFSISGNPVTIHYGGDVTLNSLSGGNDVVIEFAPVPEPTTVLAVAVMGLGLIGGVRRVIRKRNTL